MVKRNQPSTDVWRRINIVLNEENNLLLLSLTYILKESLEKYTLSLFIILSKDKNFKKGKFVSNANKKNYFRLTIKGSLFTLCESLKLAWCNFVY